MLSYLKDDVSRRTFVQGAAKAFLGVSVLPGFNLAAAQAAAGQGKVKNMIYLFMAGAMSQLDTFDPKPDSGVQGPTGVVRTKIAGIQFGEHLSKLANLTEHLAVVRSLNTTTGAHGPGRYQMRTNYRPIATTRHPGWGAWVSKLAGRKHAELPVSVQVGGGGVGPGYFGAKHAPVPVGNPNSGLQNTKPPSYLQDEQFDKRMKLALKFDRRFRARAFENPQVAGYDDLYRDAIGLMRSEDLKAFDIKAEPKNVQDRYGDSKFGRGCLLARRLVEHGVRCVEVESGGWDQHNDLQNRMSEKGPELDSGLSALLTDLEERGLLEETLVVVGTEFGRKPKINQNAGRDHHPAAFSCLLAGGGVKGGQVYGSTDEEAFYVMDESVTVQDFNATTAHLLGLDPAREIMSPDARPFTIGNGGEVIKALV